MDDAITEFLNDMRERYGEQIDSVLLPEGIHEYVGRLIEAGDTDTLVFMLRLGYLMGLQTGYVAGQNGQEMSSGLDDSGPLQA